MSNNHTFSFRGFAIAALFAAGIASTIATGGGGNGGTVTPPPPPMLAITVDNAHDVASTLIISLGLSFDVGDITGGELEGQGIADVPQLLKLMRVDDLVSKPVANGAAKAEACLNGGTVDVTAVLVDPNTFTVGDQINAVFVNCDDGDGYVINGTVEMTVAAVQGDPGTGVFLIGLDVIMTGIEITEGDETVAIDGDFTLTLDTLEAPTIIQTIEGTELTFASGPEIVTFSNFDHFIQVDTDVIPEQVFIRVSGRLFSQLLGGQVDYDTELVIQAVGDNDPFSGEIMIVGANNSSVRLVINDSTSITLQVDENGDGVIDQFIDTNFAALNGQTSTINSSTAQPIASEVMHSVTGFGSVTVAAGGQFVPAGAFGQVRLLGVSGEFGPVVLDCTGGGTASVSGSIAVAGTYSAGDQLAASYTNCARGTEVLNGDLDFSVSGYDQLSDDAYLVDGGVIESGFRRVAGGNTYLGEGEFVTSHDNRFTSPGFINVNASAAAFRVIFGEFVRELTNASVSAEITLGAPPLRISRFSSGSFLSAWASGNVDYQSVSADVFFFDEDPATGPFSGEMRVTAGDGSVLRRTGAPTCRPGHEAYPVRR